MKAFERLIQDRYEATLESIRRTAVNSHRDPDEIRLIVVTKGHPLETVRAIIAIGARALGENYVEEAVGKIEAISGGDQVNWHMIGHIQSRKAQAVVDSFDYVHSVDSLKLANRLSRSCSAAGKGLPVLLECNVSAEATKFGWPAWDEQTWPELASQIDQLVELPGISLLGLMTMAPFYDDDELSRPVFRRLSRLRDFLSRRVPKSDWSQLSMGMSGDYHTAIEEGATMVRIGTAILGPRPDRQGGK